MEMLTVNEVAQLMRVSLVTVYRLAARGDLPGRKIGRIWRFPRHTIEAYVCARIEGDKETKHTRHDDADND